MTTSRRWQLGPTDIFLSCSAQQKNTYKLGGAGSPHYILEVSMEPGQIIHVALSIAALVIALIAFSDVRSLRKQLNLPQSSSSQSS
jgi:hypothetical protein